MIFSRVCEARISGGRVRARGFSKARVFFEVACFSRDHAKSVVGRLRPVNFESART